MENISRYDLKKTRDFQLHIFRSQNTSALISTQIKLFMNSILSYFGNSPEIFLKFMLQVENISTMLSTIYSIILESLLKIALKEKREKSTKSSIFQASNFRFPTIWISLLHIILNKHPLSKSFALLTYFHFLLIIAGNKPIDILRSQAKLKTD